MNKFFKSNQDVDGGETRQADGHKDLEQQKNLG